MEAQPSRKSGISCFLPASGYPTHSPCRPQETHQDSAQEEEQRIREFGKKFVARERKKEIAEQVKLRLRGRFLPIPSEFQVVWNTQTAKIYLASTQGKLIELFQDLFTRTFDLHIEQMLPYGLALSLLGEDVSTRLDEVEATRFL